MKKLKTVCIAFSVAGLIGATQLAQADGCRPEDERMAAVQMKKAEDNERAGKLKEAYTAASKVDSMCLPGDGDKRQVTMLKRIGLQLGRQEEKQGRLAAAFDWYRSSRNDADADRVKLKQVDANPRDRQLVSGAIDHFKFKNNDTRVKELRQLAAKNADLELANEAKAFSTRKESFDELGKAGDWFQLVGESASRKVRDRAEQRGDTLIKEDAFRHLANARRYYISAEAKRKEKTVQDKALRLAQEHEKKGEITQARDFYNLADAGTKGDELQQRAEAQHQKSEDKRQKQFKKGQADLEKELGL